MEALFEIMQNEPQKNQLCPLLLETAYYREVSRAETKHTTFTPIQNTNNIFRI